MKPGTIRFLRNLTATTLRSVGVPGRGRVAAAAHRALGPNPGLHEVPLRGGGRMVVDGERNLDVFYLGEHDPNISHFLKRIVRKGEVIFDVGARFGEYTVPLALATGRSGQVFALEALQANYDVLLRNIQLNGLTNVTAVRAAVADRTTELDAPARGAPGNYSLATHSPNRTTIPAWSLDDFCRHYKVEHVGLMVIDIEGSETMALRGARNLLCSGRVRTVVCEVNPSWLRRMGSSAQELYSEFQACRLTASRLDRFGNLHELNAQAFANLTNRQPGVAFKMDVVLRSS